MNINFLSLYRSLKIHGKIKISISFELKDQKKKKKKKPKKLMVVA